MRNLFEEKKFFTFLSDIFFYVGENQHIHSYPAHICRTLIDIIKKKKTINRSSNESEKNKFYLRPKMCQFH